MRTPWRSGGKVPTEEGVLSLSQGASLGPWATTISRHDDQARPQCLENSQAAVILGSGVGWGTVWAGGYMKGEQGGQKR